MKKKSVLLAFTMGALLTVGTLTACGKKSNEAEGKVEVVKTSDTQIRKEINNLYVSDKRDFLKADTKQADFDKIEKEIQTLKSERDKRDVENLYRKAKAKFSKEQALNGLFEKKAITGEKVNKKAIVKADLTKKKVTSAKDKIEVADENKDKFAEALTEMLTVAETQYKDNTTAKDLIDKLADNMSEANFQEAQAAVDKVKNKKLKNSLLGQLADAKVKGTAKEDGKKLTKKELEKEREKALKDLKAQAEQAEKAQAELEKQRAEQERQVAANNANQNNQAQQPQQPVQNEPQTPSDQNNGGGQVEIPVNPPTTPSGKKFEEHGSQTFTTKEAYEQGLRDLQADGKYPTSHGSGDGTPLVGGIRGGYYMKW